MPVRMELSRILIREITDAQFIELCEVGGERTFPIVVGRPEAYAIDRRLKDDLTDGTFYAKLYVMQGETEHIIDSRPSDAIALGVAMQVPIYVDERVLDEVEKDIDSFESPEDFGWD